MTRRIFDPEKFADEVVEATDAWKAELLEWVGEVARLQALGHQYIDENAALRRENADLRFEIEEVDRADD